MQGCWIELHELGYDNLENEADVRGYLEQYVPRGGPVAWRAVQSGEISASAGGLILWPAKILVPVGFTLLLLQGVSELIKRIAFLRGLGPDPTERYHEKSAEEELAEEILKQRGETA